MRSDMNTPTTSRDPSGSNPVPAAKKQPPPVKRKSKCAIDSTSDSSAADDLSTHATSSTSAASERGRSLHYTLHSVRLSVYLSVPCSPLTPQVAQLSQRDRTMLRVIEYFAKPFKVTQANSK